MEKLDYFLLSSSYTQKQLVTVPAARWIVNDLFLDCCERKFKRKKEIALPDILKEILRKDHKVIGLNLNKLGDSFDLGTWESYYTTLANFYFSDPNQNR